MEALEREVIQYGSPQPAPARQKLSAGPLTMTLEEGALRNIKLGSQEALRGLYAAVRDKNWGTIPPHFLSYEVEVQADSFTIRFVAEHVNAEVDFAWQGTITGSQAGEITFTFEGEARRSFLKNRIGFCILHPMELAGAALEVETPAGKTRSTFPEPISPHQPFKDIVAMRYTCPPTRSGEAALEIELRCQGELFEMEDQRNWTDASYKTYCTPLRLPYPVEIAAGERIVQSISLRPLNVSALATTTMSATTPEPTITVQSASVGALPIPGFGFARHEQPFSDSELERLRALQPAYLWVELDLGRVDWVETLAQARDDAALLRTELELSLICDDAGQQLQPLFQALSSQQIAVARLSCFARSIHVTTSAMLAQARTLRAQMGLSMQLGAGSRANFAEFNRAQLPLDQADLVTYPMNPQVHAFDNLSLVETLQAQAVTANNALRIAAGLPLSVGPITFKPRFNSAASTVEPGSAPANIDSRQMSLFGAGWTVGSLHRLSETGARWLTYYETLGPCGLLAAEHQHVAQSQFPHIPGALYPLYYVFASLAALPQGEVMTIEISNVLELEALAVRQDQRIVLLIANLTERCQTVHLHLPAMTHIAGRALDENTALEAMYDPARFEQRLQELTQNPSGDYVVDLLPYALMHVEGALEDK